MPKLPYSGFTWLLVVIVAVVTAWPANDHSCKTLSAKGGEFRQSLGQVLFSPDGSLYVAYRVGSEGRVSSVLRVIKFDPIKAQPVATGDFPVPEVHLPRVASHFMLSQDSALLAYAELHPPQVLITIDPAMLQPISSSNAKLFTDHDLAPHIKNFSSSSLVLSAEKPRPRRPITVESVRELALNPANLSEVISDQKVSLEQSPNELQHWMKLSREELSAVAPLDDGALAFTNLRTHGLIRLLDQNGKEVSSLEVRDCGPAKAALTADRQFAVAICERPIRDEIHREQTLSRRAIVFEVNTLKVLCSVPVSSVTIREHGADPEDVWFASPSPAIWRGNSELLVAIPDSSSSIKLHTVSLQRETANAKKRGN